MTRHDLPTCAYDDLCEAINGTENAGLFHNNRSMRERDGIRATILVEMEDAYNKYRNGNEEHEPQDHETAYEHTLEWLSDNIEVELERALEDDM